MVKQLSLFPVSTTPLVVSYGAGTDSTAMLIEMRQRNVIPAAILFADVGNEHEYTYQYLPIMNRWLETNGMPTITVVKYIPRKFKWMPYTTLGGNCIANRTLPSLAFGRKSCSLKWKVAPMDKWVTARYGKNTAVIRAIGYDCSPKDTKRFAHAQGKASDSRPMDTFIYPLQEYGMMRDDCIQTIANAGLPQPNKSSCFFCPAKKAVELHMTSKAQLRQIVMIEASARPFLDTVVGLWRNRDMTSYIRSEGLLAEGEIDALLEKWRNITEKQRGTNSADDILGESYETK